MAFTSPINQLRPHTLLLILAVALLFVPSFVITSVHAASPKTDMRVVIDISGSMKKTDPQNLRIPAVKLMLNLAKKDSRFGVWTFGQYVNMLVPHKDVTPQWRDEAIKKTELINSVALYTNIGLALEKASLNQTEPDPEWDKTIVLLSDGKVDISKNKAESEREKTRILKKVLPKLRRAGFKVHSVALSKNADLSFLRELAVETGGSFSIARNADELLNIFVQASDKANAPEQVPLEGNEFDIDESVKEFTALIYRKLGSPPTKLADPRGKKYSKKRSGKSVNWFSDARYDLITVQKPRPGKWRLHADIGKDNRVTIVSNLNLVVEGLPDNVIEGERVTMSMHLSEQGKALTEPKFLRLMDITFSQRTEGGELFEGALSKSKKGNPVLPKDGRYSAKLGRTLTEGVHVFNVLVDGKTFRRKRTHHMAVHKDVVNVQADFRDEGGATYHFLRIEPKAALVDIDTVEIFAQLKGPLGEKQVAPAQSDGDGVWTVEVPAFGGAGRYEILVKVNGVSGNRRPFELVQGPYEISYSSIGLEDDMQLPDDIDLDEGIDEEIEELPEEIPEEDLVVEDVVDEVVPVEPAAEDVVEPEPVSEQDEGTEEGEMDMVLLAASFLISNILLFGGGFLVYRKMSKSQEASDSAIEHQIANAQQAKQAASAPEPVVAPILDHGVDDDEATMMKPAAAPLATDELTVTQIQSQKPEVSVVKEEPQPSEEENNAYENRAEPMELDDDEFIEIDDEFDELDDGMDGLDELDMMLSEQEGPAEGEQEDSGKNKPFVNDEFQLDSPEE